MKVKMLKFFVYCLVGVFFAALAVLGFSIGQAMFFTWIVDHVGFFWSIPIVALTMALFLATIFTIGKYFLPKEDNE